MEAAAEGSPAPDTLLAGKGPGSPAARSGLSETLFSEHLYRKHVHL